MLAELRQIVPPFVEYLRELRPKSFEKLPGSNVVIDEAFRPRKFDQVRRDFRANTVVINRSVGALDSFHSELVAFIGDLWVDVLDVNLRRKSNRPELVSDEDRLI